MRARRNRRNIAVSGVVLTALIVGGLPTPALAAETTPKITSVPDAGARPLPANPVILPTALLPSPATTSVEPAALIQAQIDASTHEAEILSERVNGLSEQHEQLRINVAYADQSWRDAADKLHAARDKAEQAARDAYMASAAVPQGLQGLTGLGALDPRNSQDPTRNGAAATDLANAEKAERAAFAVLEAATQAEKTSADEIAVLTSSLEQRKAAMLLLQQRLAELRSEADRQREREEAKLRADYNAGQSNQGLLANPMARAAVMYALDQLGKPYQFAEEGPDRFDCSGLTWASYYRAAGFRLPRVANDQYYATRSKPVALSALLPGDLLFYSDGSSDWRAIHHVSIYLGDGKMVHAPRTGDVVKVVKVNFNSVDFATRIFDAVPVPPPAEPTPSPSPTPTATSTPATTQESESTASVTPVTAQN